MSVIPSELTAHHGSTVTLFGHKVSTDAMLIAGASLVAVLVLYRMQRGASGASATPSVTGLAGNGLAMAPTPVSSTIASTPPPTLTAPETATIRAAGALAGTPFASWDPVHPEGIPGGLPFQSSWQVITDPATQHAGMVEVQGPTGSPVYVNPRDITSYMNVPTI